MVGFLFAVKVDNYSCHHRRWNALIYFIGENGRFINGSIANDVQTDKCADLQMKMRG
jgi:hypothetical protein